MTAPELAQVIYAELIEQKVRIGKWSNATGLVFMEMCVVDLVGIANAILKAQSDAAAITRVDDPVSSAEFDNAVDLTGLV